MSDGLDEIFANMDRHYSELEDKTDLIIQNGGIVCEGSTKQKCPVDSGRLRSSYQYIKTGKMSCKVGTNVNYGPPVELGHVTRSGSHVAAQPHLFPGFQDGVKAIEEDLKNL